MAPLLFVPLIVACGTHATMSADQYKIIIKTPATRVLREIAFKWGNACTLTRARLGLVDSRARSFTCENTLLHHLMKDALTCDFFYTPF